ncbi:hypothetical protein D3C86_2154740 [compost metagenome]
MALTWSAATMVGPSVGLALYGSSPALLWIGTMAISCLAAAMMLAGDPRKRTASEISPAQPNEI